VPTAEHIRGVARGDAKSFRDVYDALAPRLLYYAFRCTGDTAASEDIVHEAFVFLWENRRRVEDVIDLKAWLFTVTCNLVRNHMRSEGVHRRILSGLGRMPELPADARLDLMVTAEICGEIRARIAQLPPQTRTVIELSMQGLSVGEVAERMGLSPNSVKTLKKNGYRTLREELGHLRPLLVALMI
jgi:RNA polymerase sigma-70 factor (ECF subfamily)